VSGEPHIRKVRPDDLEEVWRVHVASSNDLLVRRGRPAARPADAPVASDARAGLASASLLEALVGCGFRIGELAIVLASRPFGRPELYLPSGPILY
jgi:hypothetical protein